MKSNYSGCPFFCCHSRENGNPSAAGDRLKPVPTKLVPPKAGKLKELKLWWNIEDPSRSGIHVKFSVRDTKTGTWREITPFLAAPNAPAENSYGVLTVSLEGKGIEGFDAVKLHEGRGLVKSNATRFVELDAIME